MIRAASKRDWFYVDRETARPLFGVPGARPDPKDATRFLVHRNLLALIDAMPSLATVSSDIWQARDAWCADRGFKLRVTQQSAVDFLSRRKGAVLADDMRLGKTISGLMCHDQARGPLIIIAPLSTRAVWLGWAKRIFPEHADNIGLMTGRKFDAAKLAHPIVFGHYEILKDWTMLTRSGTVIFDEAHALTNPDAKRTIAAQMLAQHAEQVIPMTGTPIWKLPPDFWSILNLAIPDSWGNWYEFADRYGCPVSTAHGTKYTGASNEKELHTRLSEVMLRRRWIDVSDDLPPITRSVVVAEVSETDRKRLDILAAKLASERTNTAGNLAHYRRVVSGIKLATTVNEAKKITSRGERVVVWAWHKETANKIAEQLSAFVIHGDVHPDERERRMSAWRETPAGILVATLAVAQVGIDLSAARFAIFGEIDYTPAVIGQGEMRTYDATRPMDIIFVVANHFVDQRIIRALVAKLGAADPLGVAAAIDSIDALRDAVLGPKLEGDLDRLLEDLIASAA